MDTATGSDLVAVKAPPITEPNAPPRAVTLLTIVHGWQPDAERWLLSVFTHTTADFEAVVVDNSGDPRIAGWLEKSRRKRRHMMRKASTTDRGENTQTSRRPSSDWISGPSVMRSLSSAPKLATMIVVAALDSVTPSTVTLA